MRGVGSLTRCHPSGGRVSSATTRAPVGRRRLRRARRRWRHHRRRRRARRREPRSAHRAGRARRLRVGHELAELEARARRAPLPRPARVPPRLRERSTNGSERSRTRRTSCACSRSSSRCSRSGGVHRSPARAACSAARSGCTTSPVASASASVTTAITIDDARRRTFPTLDRDRLASAYVLYDAHADDARLTLAIARTAVAHGAVVAELRRGRRRSERHGGRVVGARCRADGDDDTTVRARVRRERDRRVGRRRARPRRGRAPGVDPAGQGRAHHAAVGAGAQRHRRHRPGRPHDKRSVFVIPWERPHVRRHHRHRLRRAARRPALHRRRRRATSSTR